MTTYRFTAHPVANTNGTVTVLGGSERDLVLDETSSNGVRDGSISSDGQAQRPYVFLGIGVANSSEIMAVVETYGTTLAFNIDGGPLAVGDTNLKFTDLVKAPVTPSLARGTMIMTPSGERPIESLRPGDRVTTRDSGAKPISRILRGRLTEGEILQDPPLAPIRIAAGAMGENLPKAALTVAPQHRFLVEDWRAQVFFDEPEILMTAKALRNGETIGPALIKGDLEMFHIVTQSHEIVFASGMPTETVPLSNTGSTTLPLSVRTALAELFQGITRTAVLPSARATAPARSGVEGPVTQSLS